MASTLARQVSRLMEEHLSSINARGVLSRTLKRHGLDEMALEERELRQVISTLERSVRLFLDDKQHDHLMRALWELAGGAPEAQSTRVPIEREPDVAKARLLARSMCLEAGATGFVAQRAATAVSELSRNIIAYTPGGSVEMLVELGPPNRFRVIAVDRGDGIVDVEAVMSRDYKSPTGMGLSLSGTRRMSTHFEIDTGVEGTKVVVELAL